MKIFLLELPVFLLLSGKERTTFFISLCLYLSVCSLMILYQRKKPNITLDIQYPILTICICLVFSVFFYLRWNTSLQLDFISELLKFPTKQTWLLCTSLLAMCSIFGIDYFLKLILAGIRVNRGWKTDNTPEIKAALFIFLCGVLMLTLNSQFSPLYPFNDWDDANTIFTVGKSILKGYVPYRDLYEQKGPLIFFLQVPGALISYTGFLGMWFVELFFSFFYLYFSYKTAKLFIQDKAIYIIPVLAFLSYSTVSFKCGGAGEEYCLPFIAYAFYVGCKGIKKDHLPSNTECFVIGLTSACVFWIKYSMVGFYLGWFLYFLLTAIQKRKLLELFRGLGLIAGGVLLLSTPILLYFLWNHALSYLWQAYFYNMLFLYSNYTRTIYQILENGVICIATNNRYSFHCLLIAVLWMAWNHDQKIMLYCFLTFTGMLFTVFSGGHFHYYYPLIFSIYITPGLSGLTDMLSKVKVIREKTKSHKTSLTPCLFFLCAILMCGLSYNMFYLRHERKDLMQYKVKAILEEKGIKNPNVITWNRGETGVNTVMGLTPAIRYFCSYNNPGNKENGEALEKCAREQCADLILDIEEFEDTYPRIDNYEHAGAILGTYNHNYYYYHYYMPSGKIY